MCMLDLEWYVPDGLEAVDAGRERLTRIISNLSSSKPMLDPSILSVGSSGRSLSGIW